MSGPRPDGRVAAGRRRHGWHSRGTPAGASRVLHAPLTSGLSLTAFTKLESASRSSSRRLPATPPFGEHRPLAGAVALAGAARSEIAVSRQPFVLRALCGCPLLTGAVRRGAAEARRHREEVRKAKSELRGAAGGGGRRGGSRHALVAARRSLLISVPLRPGTPGRRLHDRFLTGAVRNRPVPVCHCSASSAAHTPLLSPARRDRGTPAHAARTGQRPMLPDVAANGRRGGDREIVATYGDPKPHGGSAVAGGAPRARRRANCSAGPACEGSPETGATPLPVRARCWKIRGP
jgi:hypothetical protein